MPGTRTAPAATAAANGSIATLHLVDASGDQFTDSLKMPSAIPAADVEAWAAAYQPATNASIWKISITTEWEGDRDPSNALALYRATVKEGVNLLWKNLATLKTQTPRLIAPVAATMLGNEDIPSLGTVPFPALIAAYQQILTGFALSSAQFTGRRERTNNPRIKP